MILVSTSNFNYGTITVGKSLSKNLTVFNDNAVDVTITMVISNPDFSVTTTNPKLIPAHGSTIVHVEFSPTTESVFAETLTITNDNDVNVNVVNLSGTGVKPTISVVPINLDFSDVAIEDTKELDIVVTNNSIAALLIVDDIVSSNALFSTSSSNFTLNPLQTKTIKGRFSPIGIGVETGNLTIQNNSSNDSNLNISVQGNGVTPTMNVALPNGNYPTVSTIDFGDVTINDTNVQTVIVSNTSSEDINILLTNVYTTNTKFRETINAETTIPKDTALEIRISFTPTDTSVQNGKLIIQHNAGADIEIDLLGRGLAAPNIQLPTDFINFGNVELGGSVTKNLRISNTGLIDLEVTLLSGDSKFVVNPLDVIVPPSGVYDVTITYTPIEPQVDSTNLTLLSNDPDSPSLIVNLGGKGLSPILEPQEDRIDFGKVTVGQSKQENLTLGNPSDVNLTINNITSDDPNFSVTETFPFTINRRSAKTIVIDFTPTLVGTDTGHITIHSNDYENPQQEILVFGEGVYPDIRINPSSVDFGNILVGEVVQENVLVSNFGEGLLEITQITSSNFKFSVNATTLTVNPGDTETLSITFTPTELQEELGTITLENNDPDTPNLIISVNGVGSQPTIAVDTTERNFGSVAKNDTTSLIVQVANVGLANLNVVANTDSNPIFTVSPVSLSIESGVTENFEVSFTPSDVQLYTGNLLLNSNDQDNPVKIISLKGEGILVAKASVNTNSLDFGDVGSGEFKQKVLVLSNSGGLDLTYDINIEGNPTFSANPSTGTIAPSNDKTIVITFSPHTTGNISTLMHISTNDPNNSSITVTLSGTGLPGLLEWKSFSLDSLVPNAIREPAEKIAEILPVIQDVLNVVQGILNAIKAFIIDISDPLKIIIEGIKLLVSKLIDDLAGTGLYVLPIFPGDDRVNILEAPVYYRNMTVDLLNATETYWQDKYSDEIESGVKFIIPDLDDLKYIFGKTGAAIRDPLDSIKGGSQAFINKIVKSFDDSGDGHRPQFSENSDAGAFILATDSGELTNLVENVKRLANIFQIEFKAQFMPPTNLTALAGINSVRLTFTANDGILPNAYMLWRSETPGGSIVPDEETGNAAIDENGRIIKDYDLIKIVPISNLVAAAFKIGIDEADNWIKKSGKYIKNLLDSAEQSFAMKFIMEDVGLENGKTYFYVLNSASLNYEPDINLTIDAIRGSVDKYSQIVKIKKSTGVLVREVNPLDVGIMGLGEFSSEVSAQPSTAILPVEGSLARCKNYRCSFNEISEEEFDVLDEDIVKIETSKVNNSGAPSIQYELEHEPIVSTIKAKVKRRNNERSNQQVSEIEEISIPSNGYTIRKGDRIIIFQPTVTSSLQSNDILNVAYDYTKEIEVAEIQGESHVNLSNGSVFQLNNYPIDESSLVLTYPNYLTTPLVNGRDYEIVDSFTGKIKILIPIVTISVLANYKYSKNHESVQNFRCISPEYNSYYFDAITCDNGTTKCPGYENRNCFYNDGTKCMNEGVSTRRILTSFNDTLVTSIFGRTLESENVPFNQFWDPFYCQNGIMAQRCDGYSKVDSRLELKGIPPDWISYRIIDLFPQIKELLAIMTNILDSLLSGTEKMSDSIISFIELIQTKIDTLQAFINKIQNVLEIIAEDFQGPGFFLLNVPPAQGGNEYLKTSIQNAINGPESDSTGFTAGVVLVYGGPNANAFAAALELLFGS